MNRGYGKISGDGNIIDGYDIMGIDDMMDGDNTFKLAWLNHYFG